MSEKIKLLKFRTLDDFVKGCNNFHMHFIELPDIKHAYRKRECLIRFTERFPELENELTAEVTGIFNYNAKLNYSSFEMTGKDKPYPYDKLLDAYSKMAELVYNDDFGVIINGKVDSGYLTR